MTAEERRRRGSAEFLPSFAALQHRVHEACTAEEEWEARVVAGIRAALDFAATEVEAISAVTINPRHRAEAGVGREREVVAYFAELLRETAPDQRIAAIAGERSLVESIAIAVRAHLQAGTTARLPALSADFVCMALLPYVGIEGAKRWAAEAEGAGS